MKKIKWFFSVILLLNFLQTASANAENIQNVLVRNHSDFMISGVLRSNSDGIVIKLVHAIKTANSANEAVGMFMAEILRQYPGYSLIDTVASPITVKQQECGKSI